MTPNNRKDNASSSGRSQKQGKKASSPSGLLLHEKVTFGDKLSKAKATDEELNSRYAKGDVRIVTESARYSLAGILAMLQEKVGPEGDSTGEKELRYKLDPEYQRRHRWSDERKSRLIESFLMNVPVPPVFLYEHDLARFEVMDGRQRLTALRDFFSNKFALEGLQYWSDLDGRKYKELPSKIRDGIDRRYISAIILLKETASSEEQEAMLKKLVFERLNSGGVKLSGQETRNAVYNGPMNQLCLELSGNATFKKMWHLPDDVTGEEVESEGDAIDESTDAGRKLFERMEDVELVLRFFAYRQLDGFPQGLNKITEFLDSYLIEGNKFGSALLGDLRKIFEGSIAWLSDALGNDAFCVPPRTRPTKVVYDPIMYVASGVWDNESGASLLKGKVTLREELNKMYLQKQDLFSGRRTNSVDAQQRNESVLGAFTAAMNCIK